LTSVRNVVKTFVLQDLIIKNIYLQSNYKSTIYSMVLLNETELKKMYSV